MGHEIIGGIRYEVKNGTLNGGDKTAIYYKDGKAYIKNNQGQLEEVYKTKGSAYETAAHQLNERKKYVANSERYNISKNTRITQGDFEKMYNPDTGELSMQSARSHAQFLAGSKISFRDADNKLIDSILKYDVESGDVWVESTGDPIENQELGIKVSRINAYNLPENIQVEGRLDFPKSTEKSGYLVFYDGKEQFMNRNEFKKFIQERSDKLTEQKMQAKKEAERAQMLSDVETSFAYEASGLESRIPVKDIKDGKYNNLEGEFVSIPTDDGLGTKAKLHVNQADGKLEPYKNEYIRGNKNFKVSVRTPYVLKQDKNDMGLVLSSHYVPDENNRQYIISFANDNKVLAMNQEEFEKSPYSKRPDFEL